MDDVGALASVLLASGAGGAGFSAMSGLVGGTLY